ncbi:MAG: LytR/AlgR family response regulator transcription factor [Cytophaga sp.]|uniref:LytR/AlgR family response regulator transcription factor n=1 Tax=Cytophaga sp. TaxID=29535 RepID=UPI003F81C2ED
MNVIRCMIIDDEPIGREILENFVKKINFLELVAVCGDAFEALEIIESHPVDLLLSDIQMPEINGLEFVRSLPFPPAIIFITAHDQYAVNSFELGVTDYLLKPVSFERFLKAANKVRIQIENQRHLASAVNNNNAYPGYFFIRANNKLVKILYKDVYYIESVGDYIKVYTSDLPLLSYSSMKMIESKLPPGLFVRIHSGYIVSINAVKAVNGQLLELLNGTCLPIAKSRKEHLFSALRIEES